MQTTLLGLALALIAAILAAFAAPLFIDWNGWRPQLEAEASALAGTRVTISGNIDLTLLPTPAFVLRDVSLGDAEKGTGMRASEMRGSLSLTSLLSGKIEASEFVVSRPAIRLVVQQDGALLLPEGANAGQEISVSGFVLEAGSLTIEDRRTNTLLMTDDFSARGELVSREGPFRLDGGFRLNGVRWILRASAGRFGPDHAGKVRLSLERPSDAAAFDAEGMLSLAKAVPRFDGKIIAAQRGGRLPWRVTSDASGNAAELRFANLELALGEGDLPITLSGEATFVSSGGGMLEATLSSKRLDLDLGDPKAATAGVSHVLPLLGEAQRLLGGLALPAQIAISADGILAGGQLMRDVRANFRTKGNAVVLERLEARLPGRAAISLSGTNEADTFSGPLSFEAEEPQIFIRWLLGEELSGKVSPLSALSLKTRLALKPGNYTLQDLQITAGASKITGNVAIVLYSEPQDYRIQADLSANDMDIDAVLPAVRDALVLPDNIWLVANFAAENARLLKTQTKRVTLSLSRFFGGAPELTSLAIEDLDGLSFSAKRKDVKERGLEFAADIARSSGLTKVLEYLSGNSELASVVTRYAESSLPLKLSGTFASDQAGSRATIRTEKAAFDLNFGEVRNARQTVDAKLRLPEAEIAAKGEVRFNPDGRFDPALSLTFKSSDLRKAFSFAEQASLNALPFTGSASLARAENSIVLEKIVFELAGIRGSGSVLLPIGQLSPYAGSLVLDRAHLRALTALALGDAPSANTEYRVPVLANWPGTLKMNIGTLDLSERIAIRNAAFDLRQGRFETVFENFRGDLAGGKVGAMLRIADTLPRVAELKLDLSGIDLSQVLTAKSPRGVLRGALAVTASGTTEDALLASVAGQGNIGLSSLEIEQTDATAVSAVYAATKDAPEEKRIEQALLAALDRGPLKVSKLEAPLVIANGIVRSGSAKAQAGSIEISLSGSLNLPQRSVEALLNIEVSAGSAVRPGATIRWAGPLSAPERNVDARALITAISLRAIERGQNPSNINVPQEERPVPAKKKRAPVKSEIETAPLLPPPSSIPSAPQPQRQN